MGSRVWDRLLAEPARPVALREHPRAYWLAVAAVCLGAFMGQLDASIVTVAYSAIRADLRANLGAVEWVGLAYLLVLIALVVPVGRLSDIVGHKLVYGYGFAVFTAASAGCALAPGLGALVGARAVQAVGAAMLQANSVALIRNSVPRSELTRALGVQGAAQAVGLALGPSLGGLLVGLGGWRLIFYLNVPVGVLAIPAARYLLPRSRQRAAPAPVDWPGIGLLGLGIAALLLALSGYPAGHQVPLGAAAAGLLAAFGGWQRRAVRPLVPPRLLVHPGLTAGLLGYLVLFGTLFAVSLWLVGPGGNPAQAGLTLSVLPLLLATVAPLAGRLARRWSTPAVAVTGLLLAGFALIGLGLVSVLRAGPPVAVPLGVLGAGLGLFTPANNAAVMRAAPASQTGLTSGLLNMSRGLGTALGIAITGGVYQAGGLPAAALTLAGIAFGASALAARSPTADSNLPQVDHNPARAVAGADILGLANLPGLAGPPGLADMVARLRRAIRRAARAVTGSDGLSVAQLELLQAVAEHPDPRAGKIAQQLRLSPNSVTTLVNPLADLGMLTREPGQTDRRAVYLQLTPAGRAALRTWQAVNADLLNRALATLPGQDRAAITAALPALGRLVAELDRVDPAPK